MKVVVLFLLSLAIVCARVVQNDLKSSDGKVRYDNYKVFKLWIDNKAQQTLIEFLEHYPGKYNIWKHYDKVSKEVHIMVAPSAERTFWNLTKTFGINSQIMIENVQDVINEEETQNAENLDNSDFGWTRYYTLNEIENWLDGILEEYAEVTEGFILGKSYEGRDIRGIKISHKDDNPVIFIESNIHAREWITSASVTWFINELLTSTDPEVKKLAENYNWYIVPVFNVDGFVYSHVNDRMWRKTRQPDSISSCIGTDANRNFDSHWMENNGASNNPCSGTYAGPKAFSEPEAKALSDFLTSKKDEIKIYISFHSFGQYLLSPYGHSEDVFPPNHEDLLTIGEAFVNAVGSLAYKTPYTHGSTASVLYVASGSSVDWVYNELDVKIGYTIEFRDTGRYGFVLPPVNILPNCEELMAGMKALIGKAAELEYI